MNRRLIFPALLLVAIVVSAWLLWGRGSDREAPSKLASASASGSAGMIEGGNLSPEHAREKKDPSREQLPKADSIEQLEALARVNPALIGKFNLMLFGKDMEPYPAWKMFGVDKEKVDALSQDLKGIFADLRKEEGENFVVLNQSNEQVEIGLPPLSKEEASRRMKQIEDSFSQIFGPEVAKQMSRNFVESQLGIAGGIDGRSRVISIKTTHAEIEVAAGNNYEITSYVLAGDNKFSPDIKDWSRYSNWTHSETAKEVPAYWSHLFGKPQ